MDLVKILEEAVSALPPGEYSQGLQSIVRHVKAAIRHMERDRREDPDSCTDAIYRMNQAYEGSLKEAYRVLAEKDPAGVSTFDIEKYLETHTVLRPRVLTQLTRYRQDYRNPSAHDYKLDFDNDEALLAVVSVCAFAKLLTNQIASKIASKHAQEGVNVEQVDKRTTLADSIGDIAAACLQYTQASNGVAWREYDGGIAEVLTRIGLNARLVPRNEDHEHDRSDEFAYWDVVVEKERRVVAIKTDVTPIAVTGGEPDALDRALAHLERDEIVGAGLLLRDAIDAHRFVVISGDIGKKSFFLICPTDDPTKEAARKILAPARGSR